MINKVFFDLDNTLIYSASQEPDQDHFIVALDGGEFYYTIVRPSAKQIIDFARDLVGENNVYILTASIKEYATQICEKAGFNFPASHIHSREDIGKYKYYGAYGAENTMTNPDIANKNNVLIDNLHYRYNVDKMAYIGINHENYLHIESYYGVNNKEEQFFKIVSDFILLSDRPLKNENNK